jgi:hypothetical protein
MGRSEEQGRTKGGPTGAGGVAEIDGGQLIQLAPNVLAVRSHHTRKKHAPVPSRGSHGLAGHLAACRVDGAVRGIGSHLPAQLAGGGGGSSWNILLNVLHVVQNVATGLNLNAVGAVSIVPLPLGVVAAETRRRARTRDPD